MLSLRQQNRKGGDLQLQFLYVDYKNNRVKEV